LTASLVLGIGFVISIENGRAIAQERSPIQTAPYSANNPASNTPAGNNPISNNPVSNIQPVAQATPVPGVRPILRVGDRGDSVSELQAMLRLLGFYSGSVDGVYQDSTASAVSAFQQAAGLNSDGIVGTNTWNRLLPPSATGGTTSPAPSPTPSPGGNANNPLPSNDPAPPSDAVFPILRLGARGPAVTRLQERLRRLGFLNGEADGVFGADTENAVKAAQQNYGLDADGIVGSATWDALLQ
jgi:peptidoglycan hydrolase-like protein with peptidoglycan-binding domain